MLSTNFDGVIYLTSQSSIKIEATKKAFPKATVLAFKTFTYAEQPVGIGGIYCCKQRILDLLKNKDAPLPIGKEHIILSIENGIYTSTCKDPEDENSIIHFGVDEVYVMAYSPISETFNLFRNPDSQTRFVIEDWETTKKMDEYPDRCPIQSCLGWSSTVGEMMSARRLDVDPKNWMGNRTQKIFRVLATLNRTPVNRLKANVVYAPNFPKQGVVFQDLSCILANTNLRSDLIRISHSMLSNKFGDYAINYIVGLDSRGFIIGSLLAQAFDVGFVMVRKKGKLPPPTIKVEYETEYSKDCFEVSANVLKKGDNVLIVDDLIATGGSLLAAIDLMNSVKTNVLGCYCPLKVDSLYEKAKKRFDVPVFTLDDC